MTDDTDDALSEQLMIGALTAADPVAALDEVTRDLRLSPGARARFAAVDPDGFRISALLVARLRFERLLHGHPDVAGWLERDGRGFTDAFRRYHATVPPTTFFPRDEAHAFTAWLVATGTPIR